MTTTEAFKEDIKRALPTLLREDPEFRERILNIVRPEFADKKGTQDRFYEILARMDRKNEEEAKKWEKQEKKWEKQEGKWDEQERKWDEFRELMKVQNQQWREHQEWVKAQDEKWNEQKRIHQEARERSDSKFDRFQEKMTEQFGKQGRAISALGARWGMKSERAFRNALAGILEDHFDVEVINVNEYDDKGEVFGRPEQIELDVIVKNGVLLICELKSSIDKGGMYLFERKARFYEKRHDRKADRLMVVSPMIDAKAQEVADSLGIDTFTDSLEVTSL